jgi:hypothetical protein
MKDGQAEEGPGTIDDVAQFLVDNPEADIEEEEQTSEESQEDNSDEQEEAPADDESEEESSEKPKEQTSGLKFKVPVKGEDGQDTSIEVDEKELIAGYQRHADYTRKTQELADRERDVTQQVATKLEEGRNHYMQQAQLARTAVLQLAGLKSPQEMAQLAQTDPSAWVMEQQRANAIQSVLAQLEQGMTHEQQQAQAKQQEAMQREVSRAWGVLGQQGIDKPKLVEIYDKVSSKYSIPKAMLESLTNPQAVLIMRDALAYQGLKEKKAEVVKKANESPKLPQRQSVPKNEQRAQQLNRRFASGKAKLSDLAAFIANS